LKKTILILFLIFIFIGCTTTPDKTYRVPSFDETTIQNIQNLISEGSPLKAVQDISSLKRINKSISKKTLDELFKDALEVMERQFHEAVENKDFSRAYAIYKASIVLGEEERFKYWSEGRFYKERAEKYYDEGKAIAALTEFSKAIDYGYPAEEDLIRFGHIAVDEMNRSTLEKITNELKKRSIEVPQEFEEFLSREISPKDMIKGTVTVWVNRGLRVERGVGFPDRVIGSGFFIDKRGYILTNYHVIQSEVDPEYEGYSRLYIRLSKYSEERIPATVIGYDKIFDVALLKAEVNPEYVFSIYEKENFSPGEKIYAIGSPVGLGSTITSGILSATGRRFLQMGDTIQVDVPINPGSSGGPLLNERGQLVGIVFAGVEAYEGINFAIPSHWINDILTKLYKGGQVIHPWLGTAIKETDKGLEVLYNLPGEPAYMAGLKQGDVITRINDKSYTKIRDVQQLLISLEIDTIVEIEWIRDGVKQRGYFSLGERPFRPIDVALERDRRDNLILPLFGMKIEKVDSSLFKNNYVVRKVYKGTVADETDVSINDPLTIQNWQVDKKERIAMLQVHIKKRKAGFMESVIQMAAYLEVDFFI